MSEPLQVVRPENPDLAIQTAKWIKSEIAAGRIVGEDIDWNFQKMLRDQDYRFVGWLRENVIVDADFKKIGEVQPGDSFVTGLNA